MEPHEFPLHRTKVPDNVEWGTKIKTPFIVYVRSPSDPTLHIEGGSFTTRERANEYMKYEALRDPVLVIDPSRYL